MGVKYDTMLGTMRDTDTVGDVDGLQDALNGKTSAETTNACTNIKATQINNKVYINWTDPGDKTEGGVVVAMWGYTQLRRKVGSAPSGITDGDLVTSSSVANQYQATEYVDTLPDTTQTYYYRLFPVTVYGAANTSSDNIFQPAPIGWADVQSLVRAGKAADYFSVGDVLTTAHSTYGTISWQIVGFDQMTPTDTTKTHSMTLLSLKSLATMAVDGAEKAYALTADTVFAPKDTLAVHVKGAEAVTKFDIVDKTATGTARMWYARSGAYKIIYSTDNSRWELWSMNSATHATSGASPQDYQETADAEPIGGTWHASTTVAAGKAYYTKDGDVYTEATVTAGDAVTAETYYEMNPTGTEGGRVQYGYNNYKESAIRQWLNTDGNANEWWHAQNIWDNAPHYANQAGFLKGFTDAAFLAAVGPVNLKVARNTVCDCGGYDEFTNDKFFLPSQTEIFGSNTNNVAEGVRMTFYVGSGNGDRIKYNASNSAVLWRLRSPYPGNSHNVYYVNTSGSLNIISANYTGTGLAPACVII